MEKENSTKILQRNLHNIIRVKKISQVDLAKELGKDPSTIHRHLNGSRGLSLHHLDYYSRVTGVSKYDLINPRLVIKITQHIETSLEEDIK